MVKRMFIVAGLVIGIGLAFAAVSFADAAQGQGDCKNDNNGNHNGYSCAAAPTASADKPGNGSNSNSSAPNKGSDHGDCKNDNSGNHNGYSCGGAGNGGGDGDHGDCKNDNNGNHNGYTCPGDGGGDGDHGDCKNDNNGKHNGYDCPSGGGTTVTTSTPSSASILAPAPVAQPQQGVLNTKLRACVSRRAFTVHIRRYHGIRYRSARITFNGKLLASRKGNKRVAAPIVLRGLPRGTFTIRIRVVTTKGRVLTGKRVYHTCVPKRPTLAPPRL
jgi:hypothetical protein